MVTSQLRQSGSACPAKECCGEELYCPGKSPKRNAPLKSMLKSAVGGVETVLNTTEMQLLWLCFVTNKIQVFSAMTRLGSITVNLKMSRRMSVAHQLFLISI